MATTASHQNTSILVVEDNPINTQILSFLLGKFKATTDFAENGQEALIYTELIRYDLIITDYIMPILCGDELIKKIKEKNSTQKIIAMTSNTDSTTEEYLYNSGADLVIHKPIILSEFSIALKQLLPEIEIK